MRSLAVRPALSLGGFGIVAVDRVREIPPDGRAEGEVVLDDGTRPPMSRTYREKMDDLPGRGL